MKMFLVTWLSSRDQKTALDAQRAPRRLVSYVEIRRLPARPTRSVSLAEYLRDARGPEST